MTYHIDNATCCLCDPAHVLDVDWQWQAYLVSAEFEEVE